MPVRIPFAAQDNAAPPQVVLHPVGGPAARQRPGRFQRSVAALVCAQLLLTACAAQPAPPAVRADDVWPEPQPQIQRVPEPMPPRFAPIRVQPNFQAPSANSCARPIQTREVPGRVAAQNAPSEREPSRDALRDELRRRSDAPAPAASPFAPTPAPALAARPEASSKSAGEAGARVPGGVAQNFAPSQDRALSPGPVTAGVVNDNADFSEYLAFRHRTNVPHRARDIRERYLLEVKDAHGRSVPDAEVAVRSAQGYAAWARTDTSGHVWLHPDAFDPSHAAVYEVAVRSGGLQSRAYLQRGQKSAVEVRLDSATRPSNARLDLVFLIDATGSMSDEIDKLKASLRSIADEVAQLPSRPDLCFGLVAYRDKGDVFLLRSHDFTNDLNAFQGVLNQLRAAGGGDYPEAMNEALHETVHNLSWRGDGATRMVVLLADAPPHLDYGGPQYDDDMLAALGKGIKVFSVGASGLDRQGEYIQRQIAQYTGGRFVFLTYADAARPSSGAGRETLHDVRNYSVGMLDRLIVRLVAEELAPLQAGQRGQTVGYNAGLR